MGDRMTENMNGVALQPRRAGATLVDGRSAAGRADVGWEALHNQLQRMGRAA